LVHRNSATDGWDSGDFIIEVSLDSLTWKGQSSPGGGTIPGRMEVANGNADCNKHVNVTYWRRAGSSFTKDLTASGQITAKSAWDYETAIDATDANLWNLVVAIPTALSTGDGGAQTFGIGTTFGLGVYVYAEVGPSQVSATGKVLRWPSSLPDKSIDDRDVSTVSMLHTALAELTSKGVCYNVTFAGVPDPWNINGKAAHPGDRSIGVGVENTYTVKFALIDPATWMGAMAIAQPLPSDDTGRVTLTLIPSLASDWTPGTAVEGLPQDPVPMHLTNYNQYYTAKFKTLAGAFSSADFWVCAFPRLHFAIDDNPAMVDGENQLHDNFNLFNTSDYTQTVDLRADAIPNLAPGQSTRLLLYFSSTNDPSGKLALGPPSRNGQQPSALLLALGGVLLVTGVVGRRRRWAAAMMSTLGLITIVLSCRPIVRGGGQIGTDRWQLANASELGIQPLPDRPGWFTVPIRKGEVKRMQLHFQGRPLPYETKTTTLRMLDSATQGPMRARIPVAAGQVVTVLAFGQIDPDGPDGPLPPTSAVGETRNEAPAISVAAVAPPPYLLNSRRYIASQYVGALIGSFDGFKTTFVIGPNASIAVPNGTPELTLAVNGRGGDFVQARGAFTIKTIVTPGPRVPTATPVPVSRPFDLPALIAPWEVLTSTHVNTFYETTVKNTKTGKPMTAQVPYGAMHMSIYESH